MELDKTMEIVFSNLLLQYFQNISIPWKRNFFPVICHWKARKLPKRDVIRLWIFSALLIEVRLSWVWDVRIFLAPSVGIITFHGHCTYLTKQPTWKRREYKDGNSSNVYNSPGENTEKLASLITLGLDVFQVCWQTILMLPKAEQKLKLTVLPK